MKKFEVLVDFILYDKGSISGRDIDTYFYTDCKSYKDALMKSLIYLCDKSVNPYKFYARLIITSETGKYIKIYSAECKGNKSNISITTTKDRQVNNEDS